MKFRALKECPQGQLPGEIFEATEEAGAVLESVGAAARLLDQEEESTAATDKKTYKRRDLRAER